MERTADDADSPVRCRAMLSGATPIIRANHAHLHLPQKPDSDPTVLRMPRNCKLTLYLPLQSRRILHFKSGRPRRDWLDAPELANRRRRMGGRPSHFQRRRRGGELPLGEANRASEARSTGTSRETSERVMLRFEAGEYRNPGWAWYPVVPKVIQSARLKYSVENPPLGRQVALLP